jgi:hypothetical protein
MKTLVAIVKFTGYPDGKTPRLYEEGEEFEASNEYADMLLGKDEKLVREKPGPKPASVTKDDEPKTTAKSITKE